MGSEMCIRDRSYQKEFNTGYSSEARKNPFLAAKLFLQDNKVNYKEELDKLDFADIGVHETVFLASVDDMVLSQSQVDASLEWISSGGNLIVGVGKEIEGNTSLLEYFNVDPIEYAFDFEDELISDGRTVSERLSCLLYTSPSPRDLSTSRMPSSA